MSKAEKRKRGRPRGRPIIEVMTYLYTSQAKKLKKMAEATNLNQSVQIRMGLELLWQRKPFCNAKISNEEAAKRNETG